VKAQLPIIVAVVMLTLLIGTTLFYITSTLTYTTNIRLQEQKEAVWRALDEQLTSIIVSAIANANTTAYIDFMNDMNGWNKFIGIYNDINQKVPAGGAYTRVCNVSMDWIVGNNCKLIESTRQGITREDKYNCTYCIATCYYWRVVWNQWILIGCNCSTTYYTDYDYGKFVCPGECGSNYNGPGVNEAFQWFKGNLTYILGTTYANSIARAVYSSLQNWGQIMENSGLGVTIIPYFPDVTYSVSFESDPSIPYSRFINRLRINVSVDVFSVEAGYKRFDKYVEYGFNATFYRGRMINDSFILPVYIDAYVDLNGQRSNYIVDPSRVGLRLYSRMLERINLIQGLGKIGDTPYADAVLYASYYYGNGTTLVLFKIPTNIDTYRNWNTTVISRIINATVFCPNVSQDDVFKPPRTIESNTCCGSGSCYSDVTLAFLFAGLLSVDINGLTMFSGLKVVWKIYWNPSYPGRDWYAITLASLYGDERSEFQWNVPLY